MAIVRPLAMMQIYICHRIARIPRAKDILATSNKPCWMSCKRFCNYIPRKRLAIKLI